jgi:hypothetical protein
MIVEREEKVRAEERASVITEVLVKSRGGVNREAMKGQAYNKREESERQTKRILLW